MNSQLRQQSFPNRQRSLSSNARPTRHTAFFVLLAIIKLRRRSKRSRHRRHVLNQWLSTQKSFKNDLQLAINCIKMPLVQADLIDKEGLNILCPEFQQMKALSDMMIATVGVVERQKNMSRIVIGPQLIKFGNFYKLYGTYFGNRMRSQKLLKKLFQQHPKQLQSIQQQFRKAAASTDRRKQHMSISNCLQQPQYRMFKYVLLLKEYIKKMPVWHIDYQGIKKAMQVFENINENNNELMGKLQAQQKKMKLDRLFGKPIGDSSQYLVEMTADTLYFPVKLYFFNNMIIVASIEKILNFQEERRYLNIYLNEFSYVCSKPDTKYFKNVTLICSQYQALHMFSSDPGSRQEIFNILQRIIGKLQASATKKRKTQQKNNDGKLSFALSVGKQSLFAPELRVEVLHIQVRPLGMFTNDTVYLTRFAAPLWLEDCALAGIEQGRLHTGPWQLVEVHLSKVMELYESLCEQYPQIQFPKIDPLTKEMNLITQSKKNTKMFEVRGYLFEQFFNFVLRHPTVMRSPMEIIHKFKIIPIFWQYIIKKNDYLSGRGQQAKKDPTVYYYGEDHCQICHFLMKTPLQTLFRVRLQFLQGKRARYCFNAFCILRMRLCALPQDKFDTVEKILLKQLHQSGRLDYPMLPRQQLFKRYQQMTILACGQTQKHLVLMDYRRKIGEIMMDLGCFLGLEDALDFRLLLCYENKERILDQDEVLFDLIQKYQLPAVERQDVNRQSRYSVNVTSLSKEEGFFSFISSVFKSNIQSSLIFRKIIYLPKQIQIKSIMSSGRRGKYVVEQLYSRLAKGQIPLESDDWAQACALWIGLFSFSSLKNQTNTQLLSLVQTKLVPQSRALIIQDKSFLKVFNDNIENQKKRAHLPLTDREIFGYYRRCIRVFYRQVRSYTYLTPVTAKSVPATVIADGLGIVQGECWIGINYKQMMVFRRWQDHIPAVKLSLQDLKMTHTTFSLFVDYSSYVGIANNQNTMNTSETSTSIGENDPNDSKRTRLRFDSKLLYHFSYLMEVYIDLRKIMPSVIV